MNKKFSTLVAVILAAGAWTTLGAAVVETSKPATAQSYVIGTDLNASAVALVLDQFTAAQEGTVASSTVTSTQGALGATFATLPQWQFIGTIGTSTKMQVTIDGEVYYLCYSGGAFSLSTDAEDANILNVKVSDKKIEIGRAHV